MGDGISAAGSSPGDSGAWMPQGESLAYGNPFMPAGGIIGNKATGGGPGVGKPRVSSSGYTGLKSSFNDYENANDKAMGYDETTSFGGKDVNIDSAYADQKGGAKKHLKFMLGDMAQKQSYGIDSFKDWGFNPEQSMSSEADMWKDNLNKQMFKQWLAKQNSLVGGNMFGGNNGQV